MPVLTTERCRMDSLRESDIPYTLPLLTNEEVRRYLGGAVSENTAAEKLTAWAAAKEDVYFTVRLIEDNTFIGLISLSPHYDKTKTELSYQFLPDFWGKGYAFEALSAVLDYCKSSLEMKEVVSETQSINFRSCRLLEKLGYQLTEQFFRFGVNQNLYTKTL